MLTSAIQLFPREDNTISFWDHPNFKSRVVLPDDYFPLTRAEQGIELYHQGRLSEQDLTVLKVVGDARCANENQLRRYLSPKMSYSKTSEILKRLRKYGFVERHKCRLAFIEEDGEEQIKPPAPFTLGIAGYKLMSHFYPDSRFVQPEQWISQPLAVQRYVAMNEMRCLTFEAGVLRGWLWSPYIGGNPRFKKPMAVSKIETPNGDLQFLIDRPQMAQNFIGYLKSKFEEYRMLFEKDKYVLVDGLPKTTYQIVCIFASSYSMAKYIHEILALHTYPFEIWFLVEEWIDDEKGMSEAFCHAREKELKRIKVPFFEPENKKYNEL